MRWLFARRKADQRLDVEVQHHIDCHTAELIGKGVAPEAARRQARIAFGGIEGIKEECRDERPGNWLADLAQDLQFAWRMTRKSPLVSAAAVFSLALGIGANTAIFSLIDTVLLKSLPVQNAEELKIVHWRSPKPPEEVFHMGAGSVDDANGWTEGDMFSFESYAALKQEMNLAGFYPAQNCSLSARGSTQAARVQFVDGNYFDLLGVRPWRGRLIQPADDNVAAPPVATISHRLWETMFASDPEIVGKPVKINNNLVQVIGVTPAEFFGHEVGDNPDLSVALRQFRRFMPTFGEGLDPFTKSDFWWVQAIARHSGEKPLAAWDSLFAHSFSTRPNGPQTTPALHFLSASKGLGDLRQRFSQPLRVLMIAVAIVLLIASANVANLLLARAMARRHELAVRLSLGASQGRILRQFLAEFLLLASLAAIASFAIAVAMVNRLQPLIPMDGKELFLGSTIDTKVLAFTAGLALLVTLIFGLIPARGMSQWQLHASSKRGLGGISKSLIAVQIVLSVFLLFYAGLFVQTLNRLNHANLGFQQDRLILFSVDASQAGYKPEQIMPLYQETLRRIREVPAVASASLSLIRPMTGGGWWLRVTAPDSIAPKQMMQAAAHPCLPGYIETIGVSLVAGRTLDPSDMLKGSNHIVVNQKFATDFFGPGNALGRKFKIRDGAGSAFHEIVGVVRDARYEGIRGKIRPTVYWVPESFVDMPAAVTFAVRTTAEPGHVADSLRKAVASVSPDMPLVDLRTQQEQIDYLLRQERLLALLCGSFAALALLLSAIGLFGVMVYQVNRRSSEIGIRLALGAEPSSVVAMIMAEGWRMMALGTVIGLGAAFYAAAFIEKYLYEVKPTEAASWLVPTLLLLVVGTVAVAVPAWRASRTDPMTSLRCD